MTDGRAALLDAVTEARAVLAAERRVFLEGDYPRLGRITTAKARLLSAMEAGIARVRPDPGVREALEQLIADSRRNEQIIAAALQGLRSARRRIAAMAEARGGALAYAPDGSRIASAADRSAHSRSA